MKINKKISQISFIFFLAIFANKSSSSTATWDFDHDGNVDALTDGLLLLRYTFNLRGEHLTSDAISSTSLLTSEEVETNIAEATNGLADIDGSGDIDALTDGLLLLRYLFNLRGDSLIANAVKANVLRLNANDIENYILQNMPNSNSAVNLPEISEPDLIQTAKNMIESIREFGLQSTYEGTEELSVAEQIELASSFSNSTELDALSSAINTASKMFVDANSANMDALRNNQIALNHYSYIGQNGNATAIDIIAINNGYRYKINSTITGPAPNNVAIDLNLYAEMTIETADEEMQHNEPQDGHLHNPLHINRHDQQTLSTTEITRSYDVATLMLSGTIKTPYHKANILSGNIELYTFENLSAWFNSFSTSHQNSISDNSQPENTQLIYTEVENNDYSVGYSLSLKVDLNLEISQTNIDNPVDFIGTLSFLPTHSKSGGLNSHLYLASFNRCASDATFTEDFPELVLGLDSEACVDFDEITEDQTDRPLYPSETFLTANEHSLDAFTLSGEFRQNNHSVKATITGSANVQRDSWGEAITPGELYDLLSTTEVSGSIEQISSGYLDSINAFGATIEDLIDFTNELNDQTNYSYDVIQQDINNLGIALEFETSATSDITGLSISISGNSNPLLSLDVALGSSRLEFDITNHRGTDLLDELGSDITEFSNNLSDYGVDINEYYNFAGFDFNEDLMHKLSITDQNNTQLYIFESCPLLLISCDNIGSVTVNNKTAATISYDQENDVYIIQYNDDSFEVL